MMTRRVRLSDDAEDDLFELAIWIGEQADRDTARLFVTRIREACGRLTIFPNRGTPRGEILTGLRSISFEKRTTIFYSVNGDDVVIIHVLHGGRDIGRAFGLGAE
jgi:toxin ParE1/3/4